MSLAVLANHMASKGRGPDSMLVHMAPSEVQGLQALAMRHGGSLTINPDTGLPEAGFLSKLLPMIIGAALAPLTAGTSLAFLGATPLASALTVGGFETLRTGDLGKGLRAGLGAYGGAGLSAGVTAAGASTIAGEELAKEAATNAATEGLTLPSNYAEMAAKTVTPEQIAAAKASSTPLDLITAGAKSATASPSAFGSFAMDNAKPLMYAAAPILADQAIKANMPTTVTRPGEVHRFSYNPYDQLYTPTGNYEVPVKAAEGGLMGMNNGGYSPGMLDFTQKSEPVVRMADGGQTVEDLYTSIGRTPDQEGLAFWQNAFGKGPVSADQAASFMQSANAVKAQEAAAAPTLATNNAPVGTRLTDGTGGIQAFAPVIDASGINTTAPAPAGLAALLPKDTLTEVITPTLPAAKAYVEPEPTSITDAQAAVNNIYRNVLGRDADPTGLNFWSNAIASGRSVGSVYQDILKSANEIKQAGTLGDFGIKSLTAAEATKPYTGYTSAASETVADEWVRNVLGREPTAAEKAQSWYKDAANLQTTADAAQVYKDFKNYAASKGAPTDLSWMEASQLKALPEAKKDVGTINNTFDSSTAVSRQVTNPYGNVTNPGDLTYNQNGTVTVQPNIPYRPYGGFSGMGEVKDAYTRGGGSLGYVPYTPKTIEEFDAKYNKLTGGSKQAYDYLTGKTKYSATPYTETGEVMKPYSEAVLGVPRSTSSKQVLFDPVTRTYKPNPDYIPVSYTDKGEKVYGLPAKEIAAQLPGMPTSDYEKWMTENNVTHAQIAAALGISLAEAKKRYPVKATTTTVASTDSSNTYEGQTAGQGDTSSVAATTAADSAAAAAASASGTAPGSDGSPGSGAKRGGLMAMAMARGGAAQFDLGDYSDGGRLLRGPGDGVSDSIPASIGNKRPARLADGEFVVPARIVSELGNGSTEAGARKLYAMMDRIQAARRGTVGKGRVAKNSRADKHLPA